MLITFEKSVRNPQYLIFAIMVGLRIGLPFGTVASGGDFSGHRFCVIINDCDNEARTFHPVG